MTSVPMPSGGRSDFSALRSLDLYITARCNRRCAYCFLPAAFLDSSATMPLSVAAGAVAWAAKRSVTEVTLLGGEPSLCPDLVAILDSIENAGLDARIVTNGSTRMRSLLESGKVSRANVRRIAVSLDTVDPVRQDRLRGRGAHRDALATIELVRELGIAFDVNVTATTTAIERIWDLVAFAETAGCRRVNVHWPSSMGLGTGLPEDEIPSASVWRSLVGQVQSFRPTRGEFFVEVERGYLAERQPLTGCALIHATNLQVMPDGRAYRCGLLVDDPEMASLVFSEGDLARVGGLSGEEALRQKATAGCNSCPVVGPSSDEGLRACIYDKVTSLLA